VRTIAVTILAGLTLVGCANDSRPALESRLAVLVGQPEAELARRLGPPLRVSEAGGLRQVAYRETWPILLGPRARITWDEPTERVCDLTFSVEDGRIASYTLAGEACGWGGGGRHCCRCDALIRPSR